VFALDVAAKRAYWLALDIAIVLTGGILAVFGIPQFLGLSAIAALGALASGLKTLEDRRRVQPERAADFAERIHRRVKYYVAGGFMIIAAATWRGLLHVHDDPARSVVSFAVAIGGVAILARLAYALRRIK
jgi:hypothetical protein